MEMSLVVLTPGKAPSGAVQVSLSDYAKAAKEVEVTTSRLDAPGKMSFACLGVQEGIREGTAVDFMAGGVKMFKGYVFTMEQGRDGEVVYTAYDQLRYLKANASYVFENMSLPQIIRQIAADFGLVVGELAETGYVFPFLLKEDESCLDIIFGALYETIIQTGKIFLFYDNAGVLALTEAKDLYINTLLGDGSLVTGYTYKRDIDSDTYNRVKLVRKNEQTGRTDVYIHEDTETIKKWGLLQYYSQVDQNLNEAQVDEMCRLYLEYYNRVLQTLTLEALGDPRIRAGSVIPVRIGGVDGLSVTRLLLAEKVTHKFDGDAHTMSIEVKSFGQFGGEGIA